MTIHHHHRASLLVHVHQQHRKGEDPEESSDGSRSRMKELRGRLADYACQHRKLDHDALLRMLAGFAIVSCLLLLLLPGSPISATMDELLHLHEHEHEHDAPAPAPAPACDDVADGTICCDRTSRRTDVCVMRGDVRTHAASNSIFLLLPRNSNTSSSSLSSPPAAIDDERIRPYTRKWESSIMSTIDELHLRRTSDSNSSSRCDVRHEVPAVVFSTGGYTGNVYHEFNDGIIPLYITARRYNREVVFVMLEYHDWWVTKYGHIVEQLSAYPPVDFTRDARTHCFPEAVVGLRIHDELAVDAARMPSPPDHNIRDFRRLLDDAHRARVNTIIKEESEAAAADAVAPPRQQQSKSSKRMGRKQQQHRPRLTIISRNGSRAIENEADLVRMAEGVGFRVSVLRPRQDTELARMYRELNATDVMVGVHGAAMTHFLFMRPGAVFIQVVPLGTDWAAETYYGEPARRMGLRYVGYKIRPDESSIYGEYAADDPVLTDPDAVNAQGWQVTKRVYLDGQNVRLDMARFRRRLQEAYAHWKRQQQRRQRHHRAAVLREEERH